MTASTRWGRCLVPVGASLAATAVALVAQTSSRASVPVCIKNNGVEGGGQ